MDKPFALLIEDDRDVSALFRQVLDMAGYYSESILDGKEAMDRLASVSPDIVLLDLQLPNMSGVEILKRMRADERMKTIPVVVITAYAYFANSLPVEPDLFLLKPVDIKDLISLIQKLRDTKDTSEDSPYDAVTHLHTVSYFSVRLVFALERVRRMELEQFEVLFADLHPYDELRQKLSEGVLHALLGKMADRFKSILRPTDTMAWSHDGFFLTLFEEFADEDIPAVISSRVEKGLNEFLKRHELADGLRAQAGVVMCDDGYESVQEILDDVNFARSLVQQEPEVGYWIYTRAELQELRNSQES
jgi:two-component system cell cycle response regulator DivK